MNIQAIKKGLKGIQESSKDAGTKKVISGVLQIMENAEVSAKDAINLINESLAPLAPRDSVVDGYLKYQTRKRVLENMGVRAVLAKMKASKMYETSADAQGFVEVFEEQLTGQPEYQVLSSFVPGIQRFMWNRNIKGPMQVLESNMQKFAAFRLVQEAIDMLAGDKNCEFYEDAVVELDRAFSLPENMVRKYIIETFRNRQALHPAIQMLIESITLTDSNKAAHTTHVMTPGVRTKTYERLSPVHFEEGREVFMMNNKLYEARGKKLRMIDNLSEAKLPGKFIQLCEAFSRMTSDSGRLILNDGLNEYAVAKSADGKAIYEVDGIPQQGDTQGVLGDMSTMGVDPRILATLEIVGNNLDSIVMMDNIVTVIGDNSGITIDLVKTDGVLSINVYDKATSTTEFMPDADPSAIASVQDQYGVQLGGVAEDNEEDKPAVEPAAKPDAVATEPPPVVAATAAPDDDEVKKKEKESKLVSLEEELEEVESSLEKIDTLDDTYKEDEDVANINTQLQEKRKKLVEEVNQIRGELGQDPMEDPNKTAGDEQDEEDAAVNTNEDDENASIIESYNTNLETGNSEEQALANVADQFGKSVDEVIEIVSGVDEGKMAVNGMSEGDENDGYVSDAIIRTAYKEAVDSGLTDGLMGTAIEKVSADLNVSFERIGSALGIAESLIKEAAGLKKKVLVAESSSQQVKKLYDELLGIFNGHINNGGKLDYPEDDYSYVVDDLDHVDIGYFKKKPDGDYQNELASEKYTLTEAEAIDMLETRIKNTKEAME